VKDPAAKGALVFQGILEFGELVDDPLFALTLELVYSIKVPLLKSTARQTKQMTRALNAVQSSSNLPLQYTEEVVLRWSPFPLFNCGTDVRLGPSSHDVLLGDGPLPNPTGALMYVSTDQPDTILRGVGFAAIPLQVSCITLKRTRSHSPRPTATPVLLASQLRRLARLGRGCAEAITEPQEDARQGTLRPVPRRRRRRRR